jgi:hypothetical protein
LALFGATCVARIVFAVSLPLRSLLPPFTLLLLLLLALLQFLFPLIMVAVSAAAIL